MSSTGQSRAISIALPFIKTTQSLDKQTCSLINRAKRQTEILRVTHHAISIQSTLDLWSYFSLSLESVCSLSPQGLTWTSSPTLNVNQSTDKLHPALLNKQWWFSPDHSTAQRQWCISTWVLISPMSMFCVCLYMWNTKSVAEQVLH